MIGKFYNIECGWGMTKAKLEQIYYDKHHQITYVFNAGGFKFISHTLY